jgi:Holliday junction resolvase RusA-like endonuclease
VSLRVEITLAGPPRGKAVKRAAPNHPGVYTDRKSVSREAALRLAAEHAMDGRPPTAQPVRVTIEQRFPIAASWSRKKKAAALAGMILPATKPDWDNIAKLCGDCLNQMIFVDDRQIVDGSVRKIYSERPGLTILVETIELFTGAAT